MAVHQNGLQQLAAAELHCNSVDCFPQSEPLSSWSCPLHTVHTVDAFIMNYRHKQTWCIPPFDKWSNGWMAGPERGRKNESQKTAKKKKRMDSINERTMKNRYWKVRRWLIAIITKSVDRSQRLPNAYKYTMNRWNKCTNGIAQNGKLNNLHRQM